MREQLEKQICDIDPIFTRQYGMSQMQSCMAYGFCYEDGWFQITKKLVNYTKTLNDELQKYDMCVVCEQAKQKFGMLTIYFSVQKLSNPCEEIEESLKNIKEEYWKRMNEYLKELVEQAHCTCEYCGKRGELVSTKRWIKYICKECALHGTSKNLIDFQ